MITRNDIVAEVHKAGTGTASKEQITAIINKTLTTIAQKLAEGETVRLTDFGTFSVSRREARQGRNPATGESIDIAASNAVKFKPSNSLKGMV